MGRISKTFTKVLKAQIALLSDELSGRGLFAGKKAKGDRYSTLKEQIETWEALLEKLGANK